MIVVPKRWSTHHDGYPAREHVAMKWPATVAAYCGIDPYYTPRWNGKARGTMRERTCLALPVEVQEAINLVAAQHPPNGLQPRVMRAHARALVVQAIRDGRLTAATLRFLLTAGDGVLLAAVRAAVPEGR